MTADRQPGDFSGLASDYARNRPDYCPSVLNALVGLLESPPNKLDYVDIGAGTGIWTRMVAERGFRSVFAVEPNDDMRRQGASELTHRTIVWSAGSAENSGLTSGSFDWLTMASSFHWADFDGATREFHRVLRRGGRFTALWNPRLIETNPVLVEIEAKLDTYGVPIKRVSSGRSGITNSLTDRLWSSPFFEDVVYVEGRHEIAMTPERYIGAWRSVNDLQVQLGSSNFDDFLRFVERRLEGMAEVPTTYLTRAWSARRKD